MVSFFLTSREKKHFQKPFQLLLVSQEFVSNMESCKLAVVFTIMVLLAMAIFGAAATVEDVRAIPPTPMQSAAEALSVPAAFAAMVSLLAWFF